MIKIKSYKDSYKNGIRDLIVPIQQDEFGIDIQYEDQPDLVDVNGFYCKGSGGFWVALHGNTVVGSIALIDIGDDQLALRKMFVDAKYRGKIHGVAQSLLDHVLNHAREVAAVDIFLGTTKKFLAAHKFYEKNGFVVIDESALPKAFPKMKVDTRFYRWKTG